MPDTITIGGTTLPLKPLPLARLVELAELLEGASTEGASIANTAKRAHRIVAWALRCADPSLSEQDLADRPFGYRELVEASDAILRAAGFVAAEGAPGETAPAAG